MDENKSVTDDNTGEGGDQNYLGSWKTQEDATEGVKNLQGKLSEQGGQITTLTKQVEEGQARISEMQAKLEVGELAGKENVANKEATEVEAKQAKIAKEIENLDPVDEGYTKKLSALIGQSNTLAAQGQHKKTLEAATAAFRQELDDRDVRSAHMSFDSANPDFKSPEMQARIKERIAQDQTGMTDALVAFREIQRDDVALKNTELTTQNEELMKRLNLKQGTDETGTVILKDQGGQDPKPNQKTTGADRNKGMQAALDKLKAQG